MNITFIPAARNVQYPDYLRAMNLKWLENKLQIARSSKLIESNASAEIYKMSWAYLCFLYLHYISMKAAVTPLITEGSFLWAPNIDRHVSQYAAIEISEHMNVWILTSL